MTHWTIRTNLIRSVVVTLCECSQWNHFWNCKQWKKWQKIAPISLRHVIWLHIEFIPLCNFISLVYLLIHYFLSHLASNNWSMRRVCVWNFCVHAFTLCWKIAYSQNGLANGSFYLSVCLFNGVYLCLFCSTFVDWTGLKRTLTTKHARTVDEVRIDAYHLTTKNKSEQSWIKEKKHTLTTPTPNKQTQYSIIIVSIECVDSFFYASEITVVP